MAKCDFMPVNHPGTNISWDLSDIFVTPMTLSERSVLRPFSSLCYTSIKGSSSKGNYQNNHNCVIYLNTSYTYMYVIHKTYLCSFWEHAGCNTRHCVWLKVLKKIINRQMKILLSCLNEALATWERKLWRTYLHFLFLLLSLHFWNY